MPDDFIKSNKLTVIKHIQAHQRSRRAPLPFFRSSKREGAMAQSCRNPSRRSSVMHGPGRLHSWMMKSSSVAGPCEQRGSYKSIAAVAEVGQASTHRRLRVITDGNRRGKKATISHKSQNTNKPPPTGQR